MVVGPRRAETDHVTGIGVRHRSRSRANPCRAPISPQNPTAGESTAPVRTRRYDEATIHKHMVCARHGSSVASTDAPREMRHRCQTPISSRANRAESVPIDPWRAPRAATSRVALPGALRRPRLVGRRDLDGDRSRGGARLRGRAGFHPEPADVEAHGAHAGRDRAPLTARRSRHRVGRLPRLYPSTSRRPTARSTRSRRAMQASSPPPRRSAPRASSSTSARISAPGWREA